MAHSVPKARGRNDASSASKIEHRAEHRRSTYAAHEDVHRLILFCVGSSRLIVYRCSTHSKCSLSSRCKAFPTLAIPRCDIDFELILDQTTRLTFYGERQTVIVVIKESVGRVSTFDLGGERARCHELN